MCVILLSTTLPMFYVGEEVGEKNVLQMITNNYSSYANVKGKLWRVERTILDPLCNTLHPLDVWEIEKMMIHRDS